MRGDSSNHPQAQPAIYLEVLALSASVNEETIGHLVTATLARSEARGLLQQLQTQLGEDPRD
jgi:hypothetical protein